MKVTFRNIGAVKQATIDLTKKLNIFCGPNNTGKTYIAYAIYGLLEGTPSQFKDLLTSEQVKKLIDKETISIEINQNDFIEYRKKLKKNFEQNIHSIFGLSKNETLKFFKNTSVDFDILNPNSNQKITYFEIDKEIEIDGIKLRFAKTKKTNFVKITLLEFTGKEFNLKLTKVLISYVLYEIVSKYPITNTHILPVERNSIYTFSKELSLKRNELFEQVRNYASNNKINPFDWLEQRTTRYPLPIRDGLKIADDLENYRKKESEFAKFAFQIEKEILKGSISINNEGNVLFISNKAKGKKLPIHLSASLVKTLSNLTFYLKHIAKKNDLIIIDEPELNLHPDNQIRLVKIFAKLINNGFRLLISTHSDYIIRELNNLIMLSDDNKTIKKLAKEYGYAEDEKILPNDVGAFLFTYTSKTKVNVKQLLVNDTGFEIDTINNVINELNERSQELFYYLREGEDE